MISFNMEKRAISKAFKALDNSIADTNKQALQAKQTTFKAMQSINQSADEAIALLENLKVKEGK